MYMHSGTTDWLKMMTVFIFIGVAVWWLDGAIGKNYTVLVIFALVGVGIFAGGTLLATAIQKQTLNAITRFNADDARIDAARMQTFKTMAGGESALQRAAAQLTVLDAKRVNQLAGQQAKLLTDTERAKWEAQQHSSTRAVDVWSWDDDNDTFQGWGQG